MGLWTYSRLRSFLPFWNYMRPFITMNINQSVTKHRQVSGMSLYSTLLWMCQAYRTILETAFSLHIQESSRTSLIPFFIFLQTTSDSADKTWAATSHKGAAWTGDTSENGSKLEVEASEGGFHEKSTERFTPSEKRSNAQSTGEQ